jgi:predicted small lipoprotein YifL
MATPLRTIAILTLAAFALSACGVRGALEVPKEEKAEAGATADANSGQGKAENAAPKPHKGFILDPLLR